MKNLLIQNLILNFVLILIATVLVTGCNAPGDDTEDQAPPASSAPIEFSESHNSHEGSTYGEHDEKERTIEFSHNADSIECSHDGGVTYSACDSETSVIWTVEDYEQGHEIKVKFTKAESEEKIFSFTPKTAEPNLTFELCTNVVAANEDFNAFRMRVANGVISPVICIGEGIQISNMGGQWAIATDAINAKILGSETNPPSFVSNGGTFSVKNGVTISNVNLEGMVYFQPVATDQTSLLDHVQIFENDSEGIWMQTKHTLTLKNSFVDSYSHAINMNGGNGPRPTLVVEDSVLQAQHNMALYFPRAVTATLRRTTVKMLADISYAAIGLGAGSDPTTLVLEDSVIEVSQDGIWSWAPATIQIDGTTFKHVGQTYDGYVFRNQAGLATINSTENNNVFCSEHFDPSWMTWTQFSGIVWAYSGTFDVGLHSLTACQ